MKTENILLKFPFLLYLNQSYLSIILWLNFNPIAEKVKELATCQSEIKALRATEAKKDKAIEEVFLLRVKFDLVIFNLIFFLHC